MAAPELLLHPVRLRVVQALLGERALTTAQLADELGDVPMPTLYRHIAALIGAGVLRVSAERRVRGALERTYRLDPQRASVTAAELAGMTEQEQRASFAVFTAGLAAAFEAVLRQGGDRDYGYRSAALYLQPQEVEELAGRVREAVAPWLRPREGAQRYLFSTVLLPAAPE